MIFIHCHSQDLVGLIEDIQGCSTWTSQYIIMVRTVLKDINMFIIMVRTIPPILIMRMVGLVLYCCSTCLLVIVVWVHLPWVCFTINIALMGLFGFGSDRWQGDLSWKGYKNGYMTIRGCPKSSHWWSSVSGIFEVDDDECWWDIFFLCDLWPMLLLGMKILQLPAVSYFLHPMKCR